MADFQQIQQRETGLQQHLTSAQMVMIAIGGAVGTGLFMGSAFAIGFAGPAVLVSYAIGAFIALLLIGCLAFRFLPQSPLLAPKSPASP